MVGPGFHAASPDEGSGPGRDRAYAATCTRAGSPHRQGMRRLAQLASSLLALGALGAGAVVPDALAAGPPPHRRAATLEQRAVHDLTRSSGARITERAVLPDGLRATATVDLGAKEGREELRFGTAHGVAELAPTKALFVRANAAGLRTMLNLDTTASRRFADHWVVLRPGTPDYANTAADLTLAVATHVLRLSGPPRIRYLAHHHVATLAGKVSADLGGGTGTLYVTTGRHPLPVRMVVESSQHETTTYTVSRIGRRVVISFPARAEELMLTKHGGARRVKG